VTRRRALPGAPALVLFDLDGTLVDSARDLACAADDTLAALGQAPIGEPAVRRFVGDGVERLVHRCLTGRLDGEAEPALAARALALFGERYAHHNARHSALYEGARQGLDALRARGTALGCVTNKPARFTEPLLVHMGIRGHFEVVVSGDTTGHRKPHPEPLLHAARALGADPARCLLVGDSDNDVRAARSAGMPVVCVSYGYNQGRDVAASAPDAVIASLAELDALLAAGCCPHA